MATGVSGGEGSGGYLKDRQKWADSKFYSRKSFKGIKTDLPGEHFQNLPSEDPTSRGDLCFNRSEVASHYSSSFNRGHKIGNNNSSHFDMKSGNEIGSPGLPQYEKPALINLAYKTKKERVELKRKFQGELNLVRSLVMKLERSGSNLTSLRDDGKNGGGKLKRVHSEIGSGGWPEDRPVDQLSVTVPEISQGANEITEKEKRTPKANQLYQSSDFILGREKIPSSEQNKKSKGVGKKKGDPESRLGMGNTSSKVFKNCAALLDRLMKHKHGWVFNNPVDVKALGLHDYFTIIKHPMDLGTIKTRLDTNWYKSPKDFAEDVRLTFRNAMTYNPKGHDVYVMADMLLKIFDEKWGNIEADYIKELKDSADFGGSLSTTTTKKPLPPTPAPAPPPPLLIDVTTAIVRSESTIDNVAVKPKSAHSTRGRKPVPKKPKAKDPQKRDMTYKEKQKLSVELQNLPSEKLDNVVQIIRKRNPSLCQNDDEIEVDIDSVDIETLWELDRFVIYYKKSLSKIKKMAEVVPDTGDEPTADKKEASLVLEEPKESKTEANNASLSPHVQGQKQGGNTSKSNSSRSSSNDSGSSSSGCDSDSAST